MKFILLRGRFYFKPNQIDMRTIALFFLTVFAFAAHA